MNEDEQEVNMPRNVDPISEVKLLSNLVISRIENDLWQVHRFEGHMSLYIPMDYHHDSFFNWNLNTDTVVHQVRQNTGGIQSKIFMVFR